MEYYTSGLAIRTSERQILELVAFILFYYAMWWKLTDKRRISDLLLFGSLLAVIRFIVDILGVTAGLWIYKVHILPTSQSVFLHALTITPLHIC